jgi:hypothetical protein
VPPTPTKEPKEIAKKNKEVKINQSILTLNTVDAQIFKMGFMEVL